MNRSALTNISSIATICLSFTLTISNTAFGAEENSTAKTPEKTSTSSNPADAILSDKSLSKLYESSSPNLCKVSCVEPHADDEEAQKVIDTLQAMADALNKGDTVKYESYLDDGCTTFDEGTKRLIIGKQAVMENMTTREQTADNEHPPVSITIDHPYAQVHGDTAVVTFKAIREVGGKHPRTEVCNATDVFIKSGDSWKRLHFRGLWKKVS